MSVRGTEDESEQVGTAVDPYDAESVAVYRLYNEVGILLYVGIAADPKKRFLQHADDKAWWPRVAEWKVEWFRDRATAAAEEAAAIVKEAPAYNLSGAPIADKSDPRSVAEWIERLNRLRIRTADLNLLFFYYVTALTVPDDAPRPFWRRQDITEVYWHARKVAGPFAKGGHSLLVRSMDEWRTELCEQRDKRLRREAAVASARRAAESARQECRPATSRRRRRGGSARTSG